MNYRHAYHAGNHADVFKHAVLSLALDHLKKKDKPFLFLDAHAGIGVYDIEGDEALRTLEWQDGLGRFYTLSGEALALEGEAEELLRPWRAAVAAVNWSGCALTHYPGSPEFARQVLRVQDRIILNELHPDDHLSLAAYAAGDARIRVAAEDANVAIKASLPPRERRGLTLIDPPYERTDEEAQAIKALRDGLKRFATGTFLLWYPITGDALAERIIADAVRLAVPKTMMAELRVRTAVPDGGLAGSGLIMVNPPWPLDNELHLLLPALCARLAQTAGAGWRAEWLSGEGR